ncbi:hypothetical protein LB507_004128 [Fusarium sp. FIESC RH6]|nr:hypothetical protein LB507_004128 [Fusarium sp. FIESC RH6]
MNPLPEMSSLQINHQTNSETALDYTLNQTLLDLEARIYQALGPHDHILTLIGLVHCPDRNADDPWFLKLEKAPHGSLRDRILKGDAPPMATRMRIALDLAHTLQHIHNQDIIWGGLSPQNILLFDDFHIKLSSFMFSLRDKRLFGDSGIPHCRFLLREPGYQVPGPGYGFDVNDFKHEMFMLGSCICEITGWAILYSEIDRKEYEKKRYNGEYPPVSEDNPARDVIQKLWIFDYNSAQEVSDDIRKLMDQMNVENWEEDQEWEKL